MPDSNVDSPISNSLHDERSTSEQPTSFAERYIEALCDDAADQLPPLLPGNLSGMDVARLGNRMEKTTPYGLDKEWQHRAAKQTHMTLDAIKVVEAAMLGMPRLSARHINAILAMMPADTAERLGINAEGLATADAVLLLDYTQRIRDLLKGVREQMRAHTYHHALNTVLDR